MGTMTTKTFRAEPDSAGERLDAYLALKGAGPSRSFLQKIISDGCVLVNGKTVKASYRLVGDDIIVVHVPPLKSADARPQDIPLDIVYEDADLVVVNKPRGMVVHPAAGNPDGTLVNALLAHCEHLSGIGGVLRPGVVHRIDKDTSGILVVAKNDRAHLHLAAQLKNHIITRRYVAVVTGVLKADEGIIRAPIARHPLERKRMAVVPGGRDAVTRFQVLERFRRCTMIEARLETGRTHQIRVHMAHIGHPLVGDKVYGQRRRFVEFPGQALHAMVLGFIHPRTGEYLEFSAPLPADMAELLEWLRKEDR